MIYLIMSDFSHCLFFLLIPKKNNPIRFLTYLLDVMKKAKNHDKIINITLIECGFLLVNEHKSDVNAEFHLVASGFLVLHDYC